MPEFDPGCGSNPWSLSYKQLSSVAIQLLVKSQIHGQVNIEELVKYPISPVPCSLDTPDGYMTRTDKAKGMNHLLNGVIDAPFPSDAKTLLIQDGNATFRAMTHIPNNFELISYQIFDNMLKQLLVQYGYVSWWINQGYGKRTTWF